MTKLIVEMEMPRACPCELATEIEGNFYPCFAYSGVVERAVEFDKCMSDGNRPDWCPIKGELVLCRECVRGDPDEEPQNDGKKYVWCKHWHAWKPEDGFCDVGDRKDGYGWCKARVVDSTGVYDDYFCADGERRTE